jgi:NitT/TauT family transport system substrate-binding protein
MITPPAPRRIVAREEKQMKLPHRISGTLVLAIVAACFATAAYAEVDEVTLAKQFGIGSLTFIVMEHEKLYERALAAANVGKPVSVRWVRFTGGAAMNDAMLSGNLSFALAGVGPLATMWAKTRGNLGVMGVCAANSMPMLLNTRDPGVKTIADFTAKNKIA